MSVYSVNANNRANTRSVNNKWASGKKWAAKTATKPSQNIQINSDLVSEPEPQVVEQDVLDGFWDQWMTNQSLLIATKLAAIHTQMAELTTVQSGVWSVENSAKLADLQQQWTKEQCSLDKIQSSAEYWDRIKPTPAALDLSGLDYKLQPGLHTNADCYRLYHIDNEDNDASDFEKNIRGIVTDLHGNILCKSWPFIAEYTVDDDFFKNLAEDGSFYTEGIFLQAPEATMLRLWWSPVENCWIMSTTRKINAFDSVWGSNKSFGEHAVEALAENNINFVRCEKNGSLLDCPSLDKDKVYCLLLTRGPNNRVVCRNLNQQIFALGTFRKSRNFRLESEDRHKTGLKLPEGLPFLVTCKTDLHRAIEETDPLSASGVYTVRWDENNNIYLIKFVNREHKRLNDLRANEPCLGIRYIALRDQPETLKQFVELYKERKEHFKSIDNALVTVCNKIVDVYVRWYVKKEDVRCGATVQYIADELWAKFKHSKTRVGAEHAKAELMKLSPVQIWRVVEGVLRK